MKCTHIKKNGERCNAYGMKGSNFCYLHNPEIPEEEKKLAQSKGGQVGNKERLANLKPIIIRNSCDVGELIIDTINKVRMGDIDVKTANCIGILSSHLMKSYELTKLEDKLDALQRSLLS